MRKGLGSANDKWNTRRSLRIRVRVMVFNTTFINISVISWRQFYWWRDRSNRRKLNIMRKKRNLKKDFRFHDDITQSNLGLMARLKRSERFENVWFYNCNVYAKLAEGSRIKFDIFDNIEEKLRKKR